MERMTSHLSLRGWEVPWKRGETVQTVRGPAAENCPRDSSIINTGIPTNVNMMKYGIKKAPVQENMRYVKNKVLVCMNVVEAEC